MILRRATRQDRDGLLAVLRSSFDGWHGERSDAYWTWKFERNPHGAGYVWVADDDGRIVACYIWNPVRMRAGALPLSAAQSVDAGVHPDYQHQGLFTRLARTAIEEAPELGLDLVYAFPTEGAWKGQTRVGFVTQYVVPVIQRPLQLPVFQRRAAGLEIAPVYAFDGDFGAWSDDVRDGALSVQRDPDYLQWRYLEHPTHRYEVTQCRRNDRPVGYSVVRLGRRSAWLVDLQVLAGERAAAGLLAAEALRRMRKGAAQVAVTFSRSASPENDALRACCFSAVYQRIKRRVKQPRYLSTFIAYAPRALDQPVPSRRLAWSIVPGDADYA